MSEQTQVSVIRQLEHRVGHIDTIPPGEGRTIVVAGRRVALFRSRAGRLYATQAECPHRGGPLSDGIVGNATVICPLHEFKFDLEKGRPLGIECERLKVYPVRVDSAGEITLLLDPVP